MANIKSNEFHRLIGVWKTSGTVLTEGKTLSLDGSDSYEYILGENYILHKAEVMMGGEKSETVEIISYETSQQVKMQYFNSKGESGVMTGQINKNTFQIKGDKIKFSGSINDENTLVTGKWYLQTEDTNWKDFIQLRLEKQD